MTAGADEEVLLDFEVARRTGERLSALRKRLDGEQVIRVGQYELERRTSRLVALRRIGPPDDEVPRWKRVAARARDELRAQALRGDRRARMALADLGELVAPRPWNEAGERDEEG